MEPITVTFDEANVNWRPDPDYNRYFLEAQQNYFNHRLQACGFVLLDEVYQALGLLRTTEGCITGWALLKEETHIDFGLRDVENWSSAKLKINHQGIVFGYIDMINRAVT
jgi:hypothetical protein